MARILIVEDDASIARTLGEYLQAEGFDTAGADGENAALAQLSRTAFDLVLLDISLSQGNGYSICEKVKALRLPVIFLTASGDEGSVVRGLDMGADDYISKPFRPRELLSRIRNVLRRYEGESRVVMIGGITVDTEKGTVQKHGEEVQLSALEYRLLSIFLQNRGVLLTRSKLLEDIWDIGGDFVNDNTLTVYVKRLREKIEDDPQNPEIIRTVRGLGYRVD